MKRIVNWLCGIWAGLRSQNGDISVETDLSRESDGGLTPQKSPSTEYHSDLGQSESRVDVRWLIRKYMDEVLRIEAESFGVNKWSEEEFLACLRQRNVIGVVIVRDYDEVLGFMIYGLSKQKLTIFNMAVQPASRRHGFGRMAIDRLKVKLSKQRRTAVLARVTEDNLDAHLFFSACGFRCEKTERGDNGRDRLVFAYRILEEVSKEGSAV